MVERRRMLGWLLAGSAGAAVTPKVLSAGARPEDEPWLTDLSGRTHRAFLDIRSFMLDGNAFRKPAALRSALMTSYGATADQIGIAFGAGSNGLAHVLGPDFWEQYRIGDYLAPSHPDQAAALGEHRAVGTQMAAGVAGLRAIGVRVLACRNTMARWSRELAAKHGQTVEAVQANMLKGLSPGVEPVPAMIAAAVLAQARNAAYITIG
jgi:intracellular sulfur oxidation DsrE/DsrF family protein